MLKNFQQCSCRSTFDFLYKQLNLTASNLIRDPENELCKSVLKHFLKLMLTEFNKKLGNHDTNIFRECCVHLKSGYIP